MFDSLRPMDCSTPGFPVHHQLLELAQTHVHWVSDAIQQSYSFLFLPSIFPSIRVFSEESVRYIRWPKSWSFSFSISLSNKYSGLISFRIDWLDLLAVQGTLKSLLQHHRSKASILVKYHVWNELPVQVRCTILDAWGWCTGTTQRDGMGREEGGGYRMGNTCIPVADSFWYLAKLIQLCKV